MPATPQLGRDPLEQVIAALTLEEKVDLVHGAERAVDASGPTVGDSAERVPGAAGHTVAVPRLGIPAIVLADGPAGVRIAPLRDAAPDKTFYATAFPIASLLASSWDLAVVELVGQTMGAEAKEYGVDVLLAPGMNIHRYALGGRNFEYYSEDPLLSGTMAAAFVNGVQSQGVGTSIKHYVANNHEWNRFAIDVQMDERALREIYLRGFEIAVKASQPWTVMSSYNKVNGEYTSHSQRLLTDILRAEWGFEGLVMTDWFGGDDAPQQQRAGNDLLMPGQLEQRAAVLEAVQQGSLDLALLDRNVANLLTLVARCLYFKNYAYSDAPDLKAHAVVARQAATEGMVLLKNASSLPLSPGASIALLGTYSYNLITGGTGSGDVHRAYRVSLAGGLADAGYRLNDELAAEYAAHISIEKSQWPKPQHHLEAFMPKRQLSELLVSDERLAGLAASNDVALITIGRNSGEFIDRPDDSFHLSDGERALIDNTAKHFHAAGKPVVVVLNVGGVLEIASWRDQVDGILLAHQPGQEGGHAITDVLRGHVNPSGKLVDTFPMRLEDYPAHATFPGEVLDETPVRAGIIEAFPARIEYHEGIYVGYRHFDTHDVSVAYPFGYGLSYTTFSYDELTLSTDEFVDQLELAVAVTNTGEHAGREVVQFYLSAPGTTLSKPNHELRGFVKTSLLKPGATEVVRCSLTPRDLASFDADLGRWAIESGEYRVYAASSSRDHKLYGSFNVAEPQSIAP